MVVQWCIDHPAAKWTFKNKSIYFNEIHKIDRQLGLFIPKYREEKGKNKIEEFDEP